MNITKPSLSEIRILTEEDVYRGKANDVMQTSNPQVLAIKSTDRISAGDGEKRDTLAGKGYANHVISVEAFKRLEKNNIPTHYIGEDAKNCVKYVLKTEPVKLEVIGRFATFGSFCRKYGLPGMIPFGAAQNIKELYEVMTEFGEGKMPEFPLSILPQLDAKPFVEFTYKSDADKDPRVTDYSIVHNMGLLSESEVMYVREITEKVGCVLRDFFKECGCVIVDYKIEFGRLADGTLIVIDEISADTCRLHDIETGRKLDKDLFREGSDNEDVVSGYTEIMRRVEELEA